MQNHIITSHKTDGREKHRIRSKRYYAKNKVKIQKRRLEYYRSHPLAQAVRNARKKSKVKGWFFDLDWRELTIPEVCPVLGIPLEINRGSRKANSPSLDRIDNNKGYTKDNVRVISARANILKNDMNYEDCKLLLKDFECRL